MNSSLFVVCFAGIPGSSKSIIAFYLSEVFGLPIFSTDNIRFEVKEDLLEESINEPVALKEYLQRREERLGAMLAQHRPFILDGAVDRRWESLKQQLSSAGYAYFLIDIELSKPFLTKLYQKTGRLEAVDDLDAYYRQHQEFMRKYQTEVNIVIRDSDFINRTAIAASALKEKYFS